MTSLRCANAPSSARLFVQLAARNTSEHHTPIFNMLHPQQTFRTIRTATSNRTGPTGATSRRNAADLGMRSGTSHMQARSFTVSTARKQARCVYNPQMDEDGHEMQMDITQRAGKRLSEIMKKDSNPNLALRIQVESGGCHGFQYLMSLITLPESDKASNWSAVMGEDDTVFQYVPEDANPETLSLDGPKVVIDQPSLEVLKGSKVDFTMELIGSQFKIADNPSAVSSCGCGTSFDIKI